MEFSGDWYSHYRYPSSGRGDDFWGQHLLHATQKGNKLIFQNGAGSPSHVVLELEIKPEERLAVGTWSERTDPEGYYKGVMYEGTIELKIAESGERMNGIWHGTGKDGDVNSDIWELTKVTDAKNVKITKDVPKKWKLTHWYPSNDHDGEDSDEHEMKSFWHEGTLVLESLSHENGSYMLTRLHLQDNVATGNWYENASLNGEYKGAQYTGAGQLIVDPKTYRMEGLWAGAGYNKELKKMQIYTGRWEIIPITES
jgi:hypothetical protein